MDLSKEDLAILRSCYELMREMERTAKDGNFLESDLHRLAGLLRSFSLSENRELEKLSLIPEHLHPQMSMRHFLNFLVPIERLVGRNLADDAILVSKNDRPTPAAHKAPLYFVLENIRSAFNVGSIFRLADCLGVQKIYLCGYTPTPDQEALQKTSLGSLEATEWVHKDKLQDAIEELKAQDIRVVALETTDCATSLFEFSVHQRPTAFIVGNERFGLEPSSLQACDLVVSIPTFGVKNSLNVSNALSMAGFEWRRQWK